jgi:hypothetical protein
MSFYNNVKFSYSMKNKTTAHMQAYIRQYRKMIIQKN